MSANIYVEAPGCCSAHNHNITHNLGQMFRAAGIDWRDYYKGDGNGGKTAAQMLPEAVLAYINLVDRPEDFEQYNPPNGWGSLVAAIGFLRALIHDLAIHPDGIVRVSL